MVSLYQGSFLYISLITGAKKIIRSTEDFVIIIYTCRGLVNQGSTVEATFLPKVNR